MHGREFRIVKKQLDRNVCCAERLHEIGVQGPSAEGFPDQREWGAAVRPFRMQPEQVPRYGEPALVPRDRIHVGRVRCCPNRSAPSQFAPPLQAFDDGFGGRFVRMQFETEIAEPR